MSVTWSEHVVYDESSPTCLRWANNRYGAHGSLRRAAGTVAGYLSAGFRYYCLRVEGKGARAHRVVWELHNGPVPDGYVVDHIDRDTKNNRIENLRAVTQAVNNKNRNMQANNASGVTGVSRMENGNGNTYWHACWRDANGKQVNRYLSVDKLGEQEAFAAACAARAEAIKSLGGYADRHGQ